MKPATHAVGQTQDATSIAPIPEPLVPDYNGACVSNLVPAILAQLGMSENDGAGADRGEPESEPWSRWLPPSLDGASQVVLLVLDGLGYEQLRQHPDLTPVLSAAEHIDRSITTVAPSTTACALTSITTGRPPSDHGLLGYRLADGDDILNVLRWTVGSRSPRDARRTIRADGVQRCPPFSVASRSVPVVSRDGFGGTGFTAAHLGSSPLTAYLAPSSLPVEVAGLLQSGERFVYAYYDGIDRIAHGRGLGRHYRAELASTDRLVGDVVAELPPGALLLVTADHGQVDVGPNIELLGRDVMDHVRFFSGEGRFRWLHAREGAAAELQAAVAERYAASTWVRSREQLVDEGIFGGPLRASSVRRLGDVALIPHAPIAFLDPADTGESRLKSRHGSLTAAEMLVPLLALSGEDDD
ncbi:MAG: alkaline phosphatase family protein [Acidimicrobiales bacterium]